MLRIAVFASLALVAICVPFDEVMHWDDFKLTHQKMYNPYEDAMRRAIYEYHLTLIHKHNTEYYAGKQTYRLGANEYADWTNGEFVNFMNGYRMDRFRRQSSILHRNNNVQDLPQTVDWRSKGFVTPIKNQMQCGSCWAFSATGSLEGQHFNKTRNLVSLSEQNLVDCSRPEGNMGCEGGLMDQAFEYIKINDGVDTEMSYPYTAMDGSCNFVRANVGATDIGYVDITRMDEMALQNAVAMVGPISVAIDASRPSFQLYKDGVYSDPECSQTQLDHGVLAVGYGTKMQQDYWLVKNSWGTSWGMDGYIMMARNMNNMCGIATQASYPTV